MAKIAATQTPKTVNLRKYFLGLQKEMESKLTTLRETLSHPVAKGDASEAEWVQLLNDYLPQRYRVGKGFVLDYRGLASDAIDIIIYDRHYSPFLLNQNGQRYIPAESVYAVFEVRQTLDSKNVQYAAAKAASVRRLERTSAPIMDKGTIRAPRPLPHIIGGLVTLDGILTDKVEAKIVGLTDTDFLDLGCTLSGTSFHRELTKSSIERSSSDDSLIYFFLKLLSSLQRLGTVPPMEIDKYAAVLRSSTAARE